MASVIYLKWDQRTDMYENISTFLKVQICTLVCFRSGKSCLLSGASHIFAAGCRSHNTKPSSTNFEALDAKWFDLFTSRLESGFI